MIHSRCQHGFTLLEVMVVMVLMGIILSFTMLSVGDGGLSRRQSQEAQRLLALLKLAQEEAILRQTHIGLALSHHSYRFMSQHRGTWSEFNDTIFAPRVLPAELRFSIKVEGLAVTLSERADSPQVILFSSGETSPFECFIYPPTHNEATRISATFTGFFTLDTANKE
jgi:general secretion pathway protein H